MQTQRTTEGIKGREDVLSASKNRKAFNLEIDILKGMKDCVSNGHINTPNWDNMEECVSQGRKKLTFYCFLC